MQATPTRAPTRNDDCIQNHCPECNEYENECVCADTETPTRASVWTPEQWENIVWQARQVLAVKSGAYVPLGSARTYVRDRVDNLRSYAYAAELMAASDPTRAPVRTSET